MYQFKIEIKELPVMGNPYLRMNRHKRNTYNKNWYEFMFYATQGKRPIKPLNRARLKLIRYSSAMPDYDGLVFSFKPVIDSLKLAGIISDDSWKCIGKIDCDWIRCSRKEQRISIEVFEVPLNVKESKD